MRDANGQFVASSKVAADTASTSASEVAASSERQAASLGASSAATGRMSTAQATAAGTAAALTDAQGRLDAVNAELVAGMEAGTLKGDALAGTLRRQTAAQKEVSNATKASSDAQLAASGKSDIAAKSVQRFGNWGTAAVVGLAAASVDLGIKFQQSTTTIAKSADISTAKAQQIGDSFLDTAGKVEFSAKEQADAYGQVAGQLGLVQGKALDTSQANTVMAASMTLAQASGSSLSSSTKDLGKVMQAYSAPVKQAAAVSAVLENASRLTGNGIDQVANSAQRLKTQMGVLAPPLGQTSALLVDLAAHGETGRGAISSLNSAMTSLTKPLTAVSVAQDKLKTAQDALPPSLQGLAASMASSTQTAATYEAQIKALPLAQQQLITSSQGTSTASQTALAGLPPSLAALSTSYQQATADSAKYSAEAKALPASQQALIKSFTDAQTGITTAQQSLASLPITIENAKGNFVGLQSVIGQLGPQLKGLSESDALAKLQEVFGAGASRKLLEVVEAGPAAFAKYEKSVTSKSAAEKAAAEQSKTLEAQEKTFVAGAEDLGVKLGTALIPKLEEVAHDGEEVFSWFSKNKDAAEALAVVVGGVLTAAVAVFAEQKIKKLVTGLGEIKTGAQQAVTWLGNLGKTAETSGNEIAVEGKSASTVESRGVGSAASQTSTSRTAATDAGTAEGATTAGTTIAEAMTGAGQEVAATISSAMTGAGKTAGGELTAGEEAGGTTAAADLTAGEVAGGKTAAGELTAGEVAGGVTAGGEGAAGSVVGAVGKTGGVAAAAGADAVLTPEIPLIASAVVLALGIAGLVKTQHQPSGQPAIGSPEQRRRQAAGDDVGTGGLVSPLNLNKPITSPNALTQSAAASLFTAAGRQQDIAANNLQIAADKQLQGAIFFQSVNDKAAGIPDKGAKAAEKSLDANEKALNASNAQLSGASVTKTAANSTKDASTVHLTAAQAHKKASDAHEKAAQDTSQASKDLSKAAAAQVLGNTKSADMWATKAEKLDTASGNLEKAAEMWTGAFFKLPESNQQSNSPIPPKSSSNSPLPKHAAGGVTKGPSAGIIGEAGDEAIIPLENPLALSRIAGAISAASTKDKYKGDPRWPGRPNYSYAGVPLSEGKWIDHIQYGPVPDHAAPTPLPASFHYPPARHSVAKHAEGGVTLGPQVGEIGEAGTEAILPLSNPQSMAQIASAITAQMEPQSQGLAGSTSTVYEIENLIIMANNPAQFQQQLAAQARVNALSGRPSGGTNLGVAT